MNGQEKLWNYFSRKGSSWGNAYGLRDSQAIKAAEYL